MKKESSSVSKVTAGNPPQCVDIRESLGLEAGEMLGPQNGGQFETVQLHPMKDID